MLIDELAIERTTKDLANGILAAHRLDIEVTPQIDTVEQLSVGAKFNSLGVDAGPPGFLFGTIN